MYCNLRIMINLLLNNSWVQLPPSDNIIFVIRPGAGTYQNRDAYKKLETKYTVRYFAESQGKYDNYPKNWENNNLVDTKGKHLGSIVNLLETHIKTTGEIPSAIIVGSRGGQVSIGKVWEHLWRGPTIIINAGCLLTQTIIPKDVTPLFITMGRDYFSYVNTIDDTIKLYKNYSEKQQGTIVHLPLESHMPKLKNNIESMFLWCIDYILDEKKFIPSLSNMVVKYMIK